MKPGAAPGIHSAILRRIGGGGWQDRQLHAGLIPKPDDGASEGKNKGRVN
jgi:hypothetical protein